jgi:plasmid stabilization system protein ParE
LVNSKAESIEKPIIFYGRAGERFVEAVDAAIASILRNPERFRELVTGVRTYRVSKFPYSILYKQTPNTETVLILVLKHDRRYPDYWRERE